MKRRKTHPHCQPSESEYIVHNTLQTQPNPIYADSSHLEAPLQGNPQTKLQFNQPEALTLLQYVDFSCAGTGPSAVTARETVMVPTSSQRNEGL